MKLIDVLPRAAILVAAFIFAFAFGHGCAADLSRNAEVEKEWAIAVRMYEGAGLGSAASVKLENVLLIDVPISYNDGEKAINIRGDVAQAMYFTPAFDGVVQGSGVPTIYYSSLNIKVLRCEFLHYIDDVLNPRLERSIRMAQLGVTYHERFRWQIIGHNEIDDPLHYPCGQMTDVRDWE